jgi:hypothetical protein
MNSIEPVNIILFEVCGGAADFLGPAVAVLTLEILGS